MQKIHNFLSFNKDDLHKYIVRVLLLIAINLSNDTAVADFNTGLDAYQKGDFKTALKEWLPEAEKGDPHAQHMMGFLYANGRGVELKPEQTVHWWQKAASQGFAPAQYTLGSLYRKGLGVPYNPQTAASWIERAADAGYPNAQYDIGVMYATGEGVKQDLGTAYMWLDQAAETRGIDPDKYRKKLEKHLTPAQRIEVEEFEKSWGN